MNLKQSIRYAAYVGVKLAVLQILAFAILLALGYYPR